MGRSRIASAGKGLAGSLFCRRETAGGGDSIGTLGRRFPAGSMAHLMQDSLRTNHDIWADSEGNSAAAAATWHVGAGSWRSSGA